MPILNFMVDFGETALVASAALVIAIWLAVTRQHSWLKAWLVTLGCVILVTVALRSPAIWPSGHVAVSIAFYGGSAVMLWRLYRTEAPRFAALLAISTAFIAVAVIVAIIILQWHGLRGVLLGLMLGSITPLSIARTRYDRQPAWSVAAVFIMTAAVVALLHGWRVDYTRTIMAFEARWRRAYHDSPMHWIFE